jgi:hypothetical protein
MMYDIAALQDMYGANFSNFGKDVTYTWSKTTGEEFINGVSQGVPQTGTNPAVLGNIFETVWTGGATSTFDLSNFTDDAILDMQPGHFMMFSKAQRADLGYNPNGYNGKGIGTGAGLHMAQGNVYNARVYNNNTSSEIHNIITGNGNDTVTGNDLFNGITLGNGNDTVNVGKGGAYIVTGTGIDTINGVSSTAMTTMTTLDYSWNQNGITVDLPLGTVSKTLVGGKNVVFDNISEVQSFIGGSGPDTFIADGGAPYTFDGGGGSNTLDYSGVAHDITVDVSQGTVDKGPVNALVNPNELIDHFSNIQHFIGGSGSDTFISDRSGSYTFNGGGGYNTLDYSGVAHAITVNVQQGTADKGPPTGFIASSPLELIDHFSNIQHFIGASLNTTFISAGGGGNYTFDGQTGSSVNTLDYSQLGRTSGITVDVQNGTVWKGQNSSNPFQPFDNGTDHFSNIEKFIGTTVANTFISSGEGNYTFDGFGGTSTLDYSHWAYDTTVDLQTGTVLKDDQGRHAGTDTILNDSVQNFIGSAGNDTVIDGQGSGRTHSFVGGQE